MTIDLYRGWRDSDLATVLDEALRRFAARPALATADGTLSYAELHQRAHRIAALLDDGGDAGEQPRCAVMGTRTPDSFAAVCGALFAGAAYVPLNPKFPPQRTQLMLARSEAGALVCEWAALEPLVPSLPSHPQPLTIVVPDLDDTRSLAERLPRHRIFGARELAAVSAPPRVRGRRRELAYVMFTSGSTGVPKGVMVTQKNVLACLASFGARYAVTADDRFSQNFELTFDLSVFDLFLSWLHGASLHVPPPSVQMAPYRFINDAALTIWFSVPSLARMMQGLRVLKPGAFPSLRWSLFCGERLTADVARAWAAAAPAGVVENLYGPTEATIACTVYRLDPAAPDEPGWQGTVPIGAPLAGMRAAVVDDLLRTLPPGATGELCMSGPQVAAGYWRAPELTAERFCALPDHDAAEIFYRTGDQVVRDGDGCLHYRGRNDDQVKVRGFRVELGEVEFALRRAAGTDDAAVVAVTHAASGATELVGFVAGDAIAPELTAALQAALPAYMVPAHLHAIATLPLSDNGKIDRATLRRIWEQHGKR